MNIAPERIVERLVTVYDVERQCLAPDCGHWFKPRTEWQRWCSRRCKLKAFTEARKQRRIAAEMRCAE